MPSCGARVRQQHHLVEAAKRAWSRLAVNAPTAARSRSFLWESNDMAEPLGATGGRVRAVVVFRHLMLRDLIVRFLTDAGVDVIATFPDQRFAGHRLDQLQPDVVVVDQAAQEVLGDLGLATVFSPRPGSASRVVVIGLAETKMVVYSKRTVDRVAVEDLIEAVTARGDGG